jgi:upstream activation factor subunit UAF30
MPLVFHSENLVFKSVQQIKRNTNMATAKEAKMPAAKKPNAAFMKTLTPSAALAAVIGSTPIPRTEVIKQLWVYIKANGLQDTANKRMINADAKLMPLFERKQVSMFDLAKIVSAHVS